VAERVTEPEPHLENVKLYQPGAQHSWYETHGFLSDNATLLFSANPNPGQSVAGQDIFTYDPGTDELENLTNTPREWEEHAHLSPDGRKISYMGNTGLENQWTKFLDFMTWLKTELYLMDPDGSNLQQITHFNELGRPESAGARTLFTDPEWSPDGTKIGALVDVFQGGFQEWFYVIEFE
jgi:Tol biopolymer transport system component